MSIKPSPRCLWAGTLGLIVCSPLLAQQNPKSQGRDVTKVYAENCAGCHGTNLAGGSGPSLLDPTWHGSGDDSKLMNSIRSGHTAAGMPDFAHLLNDAEVRGLAIYIHEKGAKFQDTQTKANAPAPGTVVQSEETSFELVPVVESGLDDPWAIAFLPDGRMLVTERAGRLRIVADGRLLPEAVRGIPPVYGGEGGLLAVMLHPHYPQPGNGWLYLTYGDKSPGGLGLAAVIRGRLRDGAFVDQQQIYKADPALYRAGGARFGSQLLFDGKGHLFFSEGDRGSPPDEQDLSRPNGKVHRVNDDGSIPKDNPFVKQTGALPSIWTYGHRNAQGLAFDPVTGDLWESEHGPRGGDELNVLYPGHNYGWPVITYGMNYDGTPITDHTAQKGMEQPVAYWVPSIATSAIAFYTGNRIPQWKNNLFVGSLAAQELLRLVIEGKSVTHQEVLFKGIGRVRDIVNGPDGYLYVVLNQPGRIERIVPASGHSTR